MAVVSAIVAAVSATVSTIAAGAAAAGAMVAAGAATAAGMAAVGSGLVAVSAVVGVAGLATSVIGMATGNKDLLKAGKIMGYIGLGAAVAGGLAGGVGGLLEGGSGFFEGVKGAFTGVGAEAAPTPDDVASTSNTMFSSQTGTSVTAPVDQASTAADAMTSIPGVSQQSQIFTQAPQSLSANSAYGGVFNSPIDETVSAAAATPNVAGATPIGNAPSVPAPVPDVASQSAGLGAPYPTAGGPPAAPEVVNQAGMDYQSLVNSATAPPANYVAAPVAQATPNYVAAPIGEQAASVGSNYPGDVNFKNMPNPFGAPPPVVPKPEAPGMWASMPEWAKYAASTSAAQGLTGLASGYFAGLSAEEKLEFEKMVNDQRQQQVNLINTRSAYAPRVSFNRAPGGLVNA